MTKKRVCKWCYEWSGLVEKELVNRGYLGMLCSKRKKYMPILWAQSKEERNAYMRSVLSGVVLKKSKRTLVHKVWNLSLLTSRSLHRAPSLSRKFLCQKFLQKRFTVFQKVYQLPSDLSWAPPAEANESSASSEEKIQIVEENSSKKSGKGKLASIMEVARRRSGLRSASGKLTICWESGKLPFSFLWFHFCCIIVT